MLFVRLCLDKPDTRELRMTHRAARKLWLDARTGEIVQAGPLFGDESSESYVGTFMLVEAEDGAAALRLHEDDPFTKAGIYDRVILLPYEKRVG